MPTTSRPKTEDKFSRARKAKGKKQCDRPENLAEKKKKPTPRGPSAAKSGTTPSFKEHLAKNRVRDDERVHQVVRAILSAWKAEQGHAEHTAFSSGIVKVSRRQIEGALQDLKNTRFTKIPTFINDILTSADICAEFGTWVYVEHDSPDWIFVRLPKNSTPVIRADIAVDRTGETPTTVTTSSEVLLDNGGDDEDEIPENVEYDDEDESHVQEEEDEE